jgi:hypothetical protein
VLQIQQAVMIEFQKRAKLRDVPYASECTLPIRFIGPIFNCPKIERASETIESLMQPQSRPS